MSLTYIHGINYPTSGNVVKPDFINYGALTDGELSVMLAAQQSKILYQATKNEVYENDYKKLTSLVNSTVSGIQFSPDNSALTKWAISKIKNKNYPAISANNLSKIGNLSIEQYRTRS